MINGPITHPDILRAIASSGHTGRILIADGHFPISTGVPPDVPTVFLNYAPGLLGVVDILRPMVQAVTLEAAWGAIHDDGRSPDIWQEYLDVLPAHIELEKVRASDLGALVSQPSLALVIATAELRTHACVLLGLGLRRDK